jgi:predicted DNA-binding transcriptional regulator YafY
LIQLQSKRIIVAKEIANRFEISLRTVYRDIKTLQDAGVPIGSENGKGYFLVSGYNLPPVMLTESEANSLVIAEKLIKNQGDNSLQNDFNSLLLKIKAILKEFQKDSYEKLENRIAPSYIKKPYESDSLSYFQDAITKNMELKITYHSLYKNEITTRTINPLGVYFSNLAWILVSYCNLKNEFREFRLDRIKQYHSTGEKFEGFKKFNLTDYFKEKYQDEVDTGLS